MDDLPGLGKIDFTLKSSDNDKQHDENENEVIKMSEQEPLNDPACDHQPVYEGDRIGETVSVICADCPYGWYIPVSEARQLGLLTD